MMVNVNDIWVQYKATNDTHLRQQLILQYAPLVKYVVGRMAIGLPSILDSDDIVSHATIGLIDAIERFDPGRGLKFESYAVARIRGSVIDVVRRLGTYPRGARRKMKEIEAAVAALEEQYGRTPSDEEVAKHLGISVEDYARELLESSFAIIPLDGALRTSDDEGMLSLSDVVEDTKSPNPTHEAERSETRAALLDALRRLPERDQQLIALYYHEELTLKEIGRVLDISESRVCQLHARAIMKLRRALARAGVTPGSG
ncbi:MAG: FliA/WhiG family RNA polymerase sigma factor [Bacteroidetes bacterium]|nr:FliA/WhiG family RNA polymerase sigma factor [Bacteroidota bacterium]MCL5027290.1 FliA/WhiG family RNA polymerase sigma factor [Chloroflexota bacterium]